MRYGFVEESHRVILAMLDAAKYQGYRLPELFSGLARQLSDLVEAKKYAEAKTLWLVGLLLLTQGLLRVGARTEPARAGYVLNGSFEISTASTTTQSLAPRSASPA